MEVIIVLVLIYGGIFFIGWIIGEIEKWNENRKSEIRDQVANDVLEKKEEVTKTIDYYKKKLSEIDYDPEEENRNFYNYYHKKRRYEELLGKCPQCNKGYLKLVDGKYGKFIGCSSYPSCKFTKDINKAKEKYKDEIMTEVINSIQKAYQ